MLDALSRTLDAASRLGIMAMLVEAESETAAAFYRRFQFRPFPDQPLRLYIPLATIRAALGG